MMNHLSAVYLRAFDLPLCPALHVWTTADRIARVEREAADRDQRMGLVLCCFYACCACACVLYHAGKCTTRERRA